MANGGKRAGAGRKSKAVELGLSDLMDKIGPTESVLKRIYELSTGDKPNTEAIKIWMGYKFGTPKQSVQVDQEAVITFQTEVV